MKQLIKLINICGLTLLFACTSEQPCERVFKWDKTIIIEEPEETHIPYFTFRLVYENQCQGDTVIFLKENIDGGAAFHVIYAGDTVVAGIYYFNRRETLNEVKISPLTEQIAQIYPYGYRSASERTHAISMKDIIKKGQLFYLPTPKSIEYLKSKFPKNSFILGKTQLIKIMNE